MWENIVLQLCVFYKEAKTLCFLFRNETNDKIPLLRILSITYSIYYIFYYVFKYNPIFYISFVMCQNPDTERHSEEKEKKVD